MVKILNLETNERVRCHVEQATITDIKNNLNHFSFDWEQDHKKFMVFKLVIEEQSEVIQGMISLRMANDHVLLSKIERADYQKRESKRYGSVTGLLCGFACRLSFEAGFDGYVAFIAKSSLIEYYKKAVGAIQIGSSNRMFIPGNAAKNLVSLLDE